MTSASSSSLPPSSERLQWRLLDFVLLLACVFAVSWIFLGQITPHLSRAYEILAWGSLDEIRRTVEPEGLYATIMRGYGRAVGCLLLLVGYGFWRLRRLPSLMRTLSLVAAPACALGMCLIMAQSLSGALHARTQQPFSGGLTPSELDARQMWAALLWTREQGNALPGWTRGGYEQWQLPSGGILEVEVSADQLTVRHPGLSSGSACDRFAQALDDTRPPSERGTRVVLDGKAARGAGCSGPPGPRQFSLTVALEDRA